MEKYVSTLDCPPKGSNSRGEKEPHEGLMHSETFYQSEKEIIQKPIFLKSWLTLLFVPLLKIEVPFSFAIFYGIVTFLSKIITSNKKKKEVFPIPLQRHASRTMRPPGPSQEGQQDPISTSSFHLSEGSAAIPIYFKAFHTFRGETVYYFQ